MATGKVDEVDVSLAEELGDGKPPVPEKDDAGSGEAEGDGKATEGDEPEVGVEELKAQLAESERRRVEAENRAAGNANRASSAEDNERNQIMGRIESYGREVEIGLQHVENKIQTIKKDISAAQAEGDFDKVADLQEALAESVASRRNLKGEKAAVDDAKKNPPKTKNESFKSFYEGQMAPESKAWCDRHQQVFTDEVFRQRVASADAYVIAHRGPDFRNTPEYFLEIDRALGLAAAPPAEAEPAPRVRTGRISSKPAEKRPQPKSGAAMPPARETPSGRGGGAVAFTADGQPILTPDQQRVAMNMGMSPVEYAQLLEKAEQANHPALAMARRH